MKDFLLLNNFSCGYKNSFKLQDISFSVPKGVFAGIVGPNGSGKTTLLKGITGELKLLEGAISLNTQNLSTMSLMEKARNIAVVSQFSEVADIPVEDYVLMGRLPYRNRWQFFETKKDFDTAEQYMKLTNMMMIVMSVTTVNPFFLIMIIYFFF